MDPFGSGELPFLAPGAVLQAIEPPTPAFSGPRSKTGNVACSVLESWLVDLAMCPELFRLLLHFFGVSVENPIRSIFPFMQFSEFVQTEVF